VTKELVEKVQRELARYEHPLLDCAARPAHEGIDVEIRYKPPGVEVQDYVFRLSPREIEHSQFIWTFQKQLYDCLHDFIIEMFTRTPQREN
jgi:hypothetical protein